MNKKDDAYLGHIEEAIDKIGTYIGRKSFSQFSKSNTTVDAVIRELSIIGEATKNLSSDFKRRHPDIPFGEMIGMRNFLIMNISALN